MTTQRLLQRAFNCIQSYRFDVGGIDALVEAEQLIAKAIERLKKQRNDNNAERPQK